MNAPMIVPNARVRRNGLSRIAVAAVLIALAMQLVVGTGPNAFVWAAASAGIVLLTLGYCFRPGLFERFPFSTLSVVGFDAVTLAIPLLAQSATGRSFIYNLHDPEETFPWIFLTHAVVVGTHALYVAMPALRQPGRLLARNVFAPLTVFRTPSQAELWLLGGIGLVATVYTQVTEVNTIEYGDVGAKVLSAVVYFTVFPFLIPFRQLFAGGNKLVSLSAVPAVIAYFLLVLLVAMATNKRTAFAFIGLTLIVTVVVFSAMGRLRLSGRVKITVAAALLISAPVFGFFENVTTAMVMVRGAKGSLSGLGYITATIDQLGDQASMDRYRQDNEQQQAGAFDYSEDYLSSAILNRLVYLKFTDLTMTASQHFGQPQRDLLKQEFVFRLEGLLPLPVAQALGLTIDKKLLEHSEGDVYESLASGNDLIGSELTGSVITQSRDVLGRWWFPVWVLVLLVYFNAFDALVLSVRGRLVIAPCAILFFFALFIHGCMGDSLVDVINDCTRGLLQSVLLYVGSVSVIRALLTFLIPSSIPGMRTAAR